MKYSFMLPDEALFHLLGSPLRPKICICGRLPQREVVTSPRELCIIGAMPHLELSDDEAVALIKELSNTIDNERYPLTTVA